jgi:hypothetical protein
MLRQVVRPASPSMSLLQPHITPPKPNPTGTAIPALRYSVTKEPAWTGRKPRRRRARDLPHGRPGELIVPRQKEIDFLVANINLAKTIGRMNMSGEARTKWAAIYHDLSAGKPGLLGAVVARGEAQTVRLALIYALLDGADEIGLPHLEAAVAVWEYCEASAIHIFGRTLGDPVADEILRALQLAGASGMTRTAIRDLFRRNKSSDRINIALQLLQTGGRDPRPAPPTAGRSRSGLQARREVWATISISSEAPTYLKLLKRRASATT